MPSQSHQRTEPYRASPTTTSQQVGWEVKGLDRTTILKFAGGLMHRRRSATVAAPCDELQGVVDRGAPPAVDGHEAARSTTLLVATDDGVDPAYAACRRAGFELARREGAAVALYDRSSESYLADPYPYGVWTSEYLGSAGDKLRGINELIPLGRRYLADQVAEGRALGLQVGAGLARGSGPAAMATACERLQVGRAILPDKMARPPLKDRILGRTLAAFQARVPAKITLVDDNGFLAEP